MRTPLRSAPRRRNLSQSLAAVALLGAALMLLAAKAPQFRPAAAPGTTAPARSTAPGSVRTPAPHIQPFAQQPGVARQKPSPSPIATYRVAPNIDGCDHNYGVAGQCIPWVFPSGTADGCAWLREHDFGPLVVAGQDRLHLDTNRDQIACGAADG